MVLDLAVKHMSLVVRKPVIGVSDLVRHKPGCTATEDGKRFEICKKGADQLRGYFAFLYAKCWFSHDAAHMPLH